MSDPMSDLVIRRVDPSDDADMDGFQHVYAAAELAEDPAVGLYSREDAHAMLTSSDPSALFEGFGAFLDGRMVAESILMGSNRDNLHLVRILLWVDPEHQKRGHGARLLAHTERRARALGRKVVLAQARAGRGLAGNRRFAERHGYRLTMTEIERRLILPVDRAELDRLADEAAPHHTGYEIRSSVGRVPTELRASYVALRNLLEGERPHGELEVEPAGGTVDDLEATEREREEAGRRTLAAFAVRDGVVVAYADASVPGDGFTHIDQYGTLVHPDHRGHRLGMAVKCAQLRLVADHFPDKEYVTTSNAEVNAHMVAINVALGFEIHQVWDEFEKRLGPIAS
jgi:GNAT superfamily N-acetyltransferase